MVIVHTTKRPYSDNRVVNLLLLWNIFCLIVTIQKIVVSGNLHLNVVMPTYDKEFLKILEPVIFEYTGMNLDFQYSMLFSFVPVVVDGFVTFWINTVLFSSLVDNKKNTATTCQTLHVNYRSLKETLNELVKQIHNVVLLFFSVFSAEPFVVAKKSEYV